MSSIVSISASSVDISTISSAHNGLSQYSNPIVRPNPLFSYLVTLESQKTFDVVHHMLLLEKFYYEVLPEIWKVIQDRYSDMSSQVKWNGYTSKHFNIKQGVRQAGVLSTHLLNVPFDCLFVMAFHLILLF
jgi:hypothetical protein